MTGAAQGFGREFAVAIARAGANICVADLVEPLVAAEIVSLEGVGAIALKAHGTSSADMSHMASAGVD
jgi:NAD(P)-dependent dehydrogenase (short-subunit alcohol dehydrogenase family)